MTEHQQGKLEERAIETIDPDGRRVIDVSTLDDNKFGPQSPVWWGNTLLMFIESMSLLLMIVTYFYLHQNFESWPPPQPLKMPPNFKPYPSLPIPIIETLLMIGGAFLMYWTDQKSKNLDRANTIRGLWMMFVLAIVLIVLRSFDFAGTQFRWNDNAYASTVWTIVGLHLTYIAAAAGEFFIMGAWTSTHELEPHHAHDVNLAGIFWYWVLATWLIVFVVVYISPRF